MLERDLERELVDLGQRIEYPATPDLAAPVRRRLLERSERPLNARLIRGRLEASAASLGRVFWPRRRSLALALVALLAIAVGALALWPEARTVVADRLGLRGVQIVQVVQVPAITTPLPATTGASLGLGQPLTLEQARARVTFAVRLPSALPAPDEVYVLNSPPGGQVALIYAPRADLPAAGTTGVGLLLTEFQGSFQSGGPIVKGLPPGTSIEEVSVNGARGYWIGGDPHMFLFQSASGQTQAETTRLAANVLLWEDSKVTLRLETALPRDAALSIATTAH